MFLSVRFSPLDARTYTYTHDGPDPVKPGDFVMVDTAKGAKKVEVVAVDVEEPAFACKPIASICPAEDAA